MLLTHLPRSVSPDCKALSRPIAWCQRWPPHLPRPRRHCARVAGPDGSSLEQSANSPEGQLLAQTLLKSHEREELPTAETLLLHQRKTAHDLFECPGPAECLIFVLYSRLSTEQHRWWLCISLFSSWVLCSNSSGGTF